MRLRPIVFFVASGMALWTSSGCERDGTGHNGQEDVTKDEARSMGKADWPFDFCESFGWYGDGICDDFCPEPDPDCQDAICGPIPNGACPEGQVCNIESCGLGATGHCVARPAACYEYYAPVCGCDGNTYSNDCFRLMAGVALDHQGECEQPATCGGIAGLQCPEGQVCDYDGCYPDASGVCVERPDFCTEEYAPVCGCDGNTYSNDCLRLQAGVGLAHEGVCE